MINALQLSCTPCRSVIFRLENGPKVNSCPVSLLMRLAGFQFGWMSFRLAIFSGFLNWIECFWRSFVQFSEDDIGRNCFHLLTSPEAEQRQAAAAAANGQRRRNWQGHLTLLNVSIEILDCIQVPFVSFFFYLTLLQLKSSPGFHGDEDEWAFIRMRNNPMQTFTSPLPTTCTNSLGNQKQFDYYAFMQYF